MKPAGWVGEAARESMILAELQARPLVSVPGGGTGQPTGRRRERTMRLRRGRGGAPSADVDKRKTTRQTNSH